MEVILLERIEKLGQMGDIVKVKPGFARNFLLPQKKALRATKDNLTHFEHQRAELEASNLSEKTEAEAAASKMEGLSLVLIRSASEAGHLYGSVSARDIAEALADNSVTVQRRQVELAAPIKTLGLHEARVRLHPEVAVTVVLNVAQSEDEARTQAAHLAPAVEEAAPEAAAEAVVEAAEEVAEASITEEVAEEFFEEPGAATEGGADDEAEKPA